MKYRVQILDAGKWKTLACRDLSMKSEPDAVAWRDYCKATNIENEYRAQFYHPAAGWKTLP